MVATSMAPVPGAVGLVYAYLREQINRGALSHGAWVRQDGVAADLGVSRMPVREALRQLESEGYVVCHAHRGWAVAGLSAEDVEEICLMRVALEGFAARLGAARIGPVDLGRLEACLQRMMDLAEVPDPLALLTPDFEFHDILYAAAGRPPMLKRIHGLRQSISRYLHLGITSPGMMGSAVSDHKGILEACRLGQTDLVQQRAQAHITRFARLVIERLRGGSNTETESDLIPTNWTRAASERGG